MALAQRLDVDHPVADHDALRRVADRARPATLAGERTLPVLPALAGLVPGAGLQRGTTVTVASSPGAGGATALALALGAAASREGSWSAVVGLAPLGLAAAGELGLAFERLLVVPEVPPPAWPDVVAALLDAVDLVYVRPPRHVRPGDVRRLAARARERGSVLVALAGTAAWSQPAGLRLGVASSAWSGPRGGGAGRLVARRLEVVADGRGAAGRPRRVALWLPGPDGGVTLADEAPPPAVAPDGRGVVDRAGAARSAGGREDPRRRVAG